MQKIYLAGGCFWGMEDLFRRLPGVLDTETGYCGGKNQNPTYEFHPGHAETLEVTYDENRTTYENLLDFFFRIHDPTTLNRQGNDIGTSYRSAIFFQNDQERRRARKFINLVDASGAWKNHVTTTLEPLEKFWPAEPVHQNYLQHYPAGYTCHFVRDMPSFI